MEEVDFVKKKYNYVGTIEKFINLNEGYNYQ